jgi:hypothetical protein
MQTIEIYNDFDSIDLDIDYKKNTCEIAVCVDNTYGAVSLTADIDVKKAKEIIDALSAFVTSNGFKGN